jgi:hypothetical protein
VASEIKLVSTINAERPSMLRLGGGSPESRTREPRTVPIGSYSETASSITTFTDWSCTSGSGAVKYSISARIRRAKRSTCSSMRCAFSTALSGVGLDRINDARPPITCRGVPIK